MPTLAKIVFRVVDYVTYIPQNKHEMLYDREKVVKIKKNIRYSKTDKRECKLDIYRIPGKKPQPVMFYIHGGGFTAGSKFCREGLATWMAKLGIAVVNINYGLSPKYNFKESMGMICEALEWLNKNARKYNLDTKRVCFGGDSSGGYCALYLTDICTNKKLREELGFKKPSITPAGLYTCCGIFDLEKMLHIPVLGLVSGLLSRDVMGATKKQFKSHPDRELCSPINYVNKNFPKEIFVNYSKKDLLCGGQSDKLMELYDKYGLKYTECYSTKFLDNHCYQLNWNGEACDALNEALSKFIKDFVANS